MFSASYGIGISNLLPNILLGHDPGPFLYIYCLVLGYNVRLSRPMRVPAPVYHALYTDYTLLQYSILLRFANCSVIVNKLVIVMYISLSCYVVRFIVLLL